MKELLMTGNHVIGTQESPQEISDSSDDGIMSNSMAPSTNQGLIPLSRHILQDQREYCYESLLPGACLNDEVINALLQELKVGSCHIFNTYLPRRKSPKYVRKVRKGAREATLWVFPVHQPHPSNRKLDHWMGIVANKETSEVNLHNSLRTTSSSDFAKQIFDGILCQDLKIDDKTWKWMVSVGLSSKV
jgi:hypothetical protein